MNYVNLIADIDELKWFYDNILPPLAPAEVYFLSLSARSKYLTNEDKKALELGRTEMFSKSIVRKQSWERFVRTIRKLECSEEGYTTKNNSSIPSKCMVCYMNINPSNTIKALYEFQKVYNEYMMELSEIAIKGRDSENIMNRLNKIDNNLMTCYQQATGTRHWVDIDCDVDKAWKAYDEPEIEQYLDLKGLKTYYWIDTKSGYHLLIKKQELKFNPNDLAEYIKQGYSNWLYSSYDVIIADEKLKECEIIKNDNSMIPTPGTYQADHIVKVINK